MQHAEIAPLTPDLDRAHALPVAAIEKALGVDAEQGLDNAESARRLALFGPNDIAERPRTSVWRLLWDALTEPFVVLLLVAGLFAVALGEVRDGLLVLIGLVPIVGADVVTSYRGERALDALRQSTAPVATVRREGVAVSVPAAEIAPGDVALYAVGDVVPADLRITRADALLLDRSALTGESLPEHGSADVDLPEAALVDRHSIAYSGTSVVQGRGEGIAIATGPRSQFGRIAAGLLPEKRRRSPVQLELDRIVRILLVVAVSLIVITSGLALARGESIGVAVLAGVTAAIAAIPEEPPVLLAVILGLGAYRLLRRQVLVRRLTAQETLSVVDLIVTDKTGTLTQNRLSLDAAMTPNGALVEEDLRRVTELALRAEDDAWHRSRGSRPSSFTAALERQLVETGGVPQLEPADLIESEPPSGMRAFSRTRARATAGEQELVLGAPEAVLALVADADDYTAWFELTHVNAEAGRRLLLLAAKASVSPLIPVALLAFSDPLREDVPAALSEATDAGIQTVIVTGDHPGTAARIASAAGLATGEPVTGEQLSSWTDERLAEELAALGVVARALPEDKLRIVRAGRQAGRVVAVTGDGVNDAPALQHADVGVAMGSGTAVAREASDLVLGDDSFSTLINGLREGRRMVANIQKGLIFLISTHVSLLGFVLVATLAGFSQPLLPIHILWLEFFIDASASVAFEREPEEPGLMQRPPRKRGVPLLDNGLLARISVAGAWTALGALAIMVTHAGGADHARWIAFNALVFGQVVRAYANRSLVYPLTRLAPNWLLLVVSFGALAAQVAIPYVPIVAESFQATLLDAEDWALVAAVALTPAVIAQLLRIGGRAWVA